MKIEPTLCVVCWGRNQRVGEKLVDLMFIQPKAADVALVDFRPDYVRGWMCGECMVVHWASDPDVRGGTKMEDPIEEVALQILDTKAEIERLDETLANLREQLTSMLVALGTQPDESMVLEYGSVKVTWVKGRTTSKLDRVALVNAGVTAEVLDACTKTTVGAPSVQVRRR